MHPGLWAWILRKNILLPILKNRNKMTVQCEKIAIQHEDFPQTAQYPCYFGFFRWCAWHCHHWTGVDEKWFAGWWPVPLRLEWRLWCPSCKTGISCSHQLRLQVWAMTCSPFMFRWHVVPCLAHFCLCAGPVATTIMSHSTIMRLNLTFAQQEELSGCARNLALQCATKVSII